MNKAIILSGLPGSGKSTYAKQAYPKAMVFSADQYFNQPDGTWKFDPSKLSAAHGECLIKFIEAVRYGFMVMEITAVTRTLVVDNTNLSVTEMAPYVATAQAYGWEVELVTILCDPVVAYSRQTHGVPESTFERMMKTLASRELPLWWPAARTVYIDSWSGLPLER